MRKRITSLLLTLVMLLSLLPTTAFAASYAKISVNGILLEDNYYLKSNSATDSNYSKVEPSSYVAWYRNGVLTLKDYNGKGIETQGVAAGELTVKLIGSNSINNGALQSDNGGDITVTSDSSGTLSISKTTSGSNPAIGIETGLSGSTVASLTRNNHIGAGFCASQCEGLDNAQLTYRGSQFLKCLLVEVDTRLVGVWLDEVDCYFIDSRTAARLHIVH